MAANVAEKILDYMETDVLTPITCDGDVLQELAIDFIFFRPSTTTADYESLWELQFGAALRRVRCELIGRPMN